MGKVGVGIAGRVEVEEPGAGNPGRDELGPGIPRLLGEVPGRIEDDQPRRAEAARQPLRGDQGSGRERLACQDQPRVRSNSCMNATSASTLSREQAL